jgi:DNA (cytosine-5)-methyltransferase 1
MPDPRPTYYNENDAYVARWLCNLIEAGHLPKGDVDQRSIADVRPDDLRGYCRCHFFAGAGGWPLALRQAGVPDELGYIWTGSPPCQPWSPAGKRRGFDDERHLWPVWFDLIRQCRPQRILGEQVSRAIAKGWLDLVCHDLESAGYAVGAVVLGAHSVGAPHKRQRLFWVADSLRAGEQPHARGVGAHERGGQRPQSKTGRETETTEHRRSTHRVGNADGRRQFQGKERNIEDEGSGRLATRQPGPSRDLGDADQQRLQPSLGKTRIERTGEEPNPACIPGNAELLGSPAILELGGAEKEWRLLEPERPSDSRGPWDNAEWLWCRDEKYRPVEPGTLPMAARVPADVGKLRAYGNAVCVPAAQAFVETFMDSRKASERFGVAPQGRPVLHDENRKAIKRHRLAHDEVNGNAITVKHAAKFVGTNRKQIRNPLPAPLKVPSSSINVDSTIAQPLRRKTRKSMSRRSGQTSKPFKAGKWWRVRARLDVPGFEKRRQVSLKVCPVALKLPMPAIRRMASEIINKSGANSEERFNRVVLGEGVTFREQAKLYLQEATTRNREPIRNPTSIEGAFHKWVIPAIGDLPVSMVDNRTVKPLVRKMVKGGLAPETVNKYVRYVKQVVASNLTPNGEPIYPRVWNPKVMDLPLVIHQQQKRPAQKVDGINLLIASAESDEERYLYVLLAATGMRISEALALEAKHFINGGLTIKIEQQIQKDCPRVTDKLKTPASYRKIDLHPDVADYVRKFVSGKSGLILHTSNGTPYLYGNLADDWLDPLLAKLGLYESGMGWHSFKRFRNTWLRKQLVQEDIRLHWLAHQPKEMSEVYCMLKEDVPARLAEAERVGYGFSLPKEYVPSVPRKGLFVVNRKVPATAILVNRMNETGGV